MEVNKNLVILVDDDQDDLEILCELLHKINPFLKCRTYTDGESLLTDLNLMLELPAVIILDHNMPKMRGTECLKIIRSIERLKTIPIVVCSTNITQTDKNYYDTQRAGYIKKQPTADIYLREITEALKATVNI